MAQILVRQLPESVKARLRARARRHGRSLEAEARSVLSAAADAEGAPAEGFGTYWSRLFHDFGLRPGEELPRLPASYPRAVRFKP